MAYIECFQLRKATLLCPALTVRAAFKAGIVQDCQMPIRCRVDSEFDHVSPGIERDAYRRNGVLDEFMCRGMDTGGSAST